MKRHPALGEAGAVHRGMPPTIAQCHAVQGVLCGPDGGQVGQQQRQYVVGDDAWAGGTLRLRRGQVVEQATGPTGLTGLAKDFWQGFQGLAQAAQQQGAAFQAHQRVGRAHLKSLRQLGCANGLQALRVGTPRMLWVAGEQARFESVKAGNPQPFGASNTQAGVGLLVGPVGSGPCVQQHADQGQVYLGTRAFGGGGTGRGECGVQLGFAVHPARLKVAPTAVVRNFQIGVALGGDLGHQRSSGGQGGIVHQQPGRLASTRPGQQRLGAGAHCIGSA